MLYISLVGVIFIAITIFIHKHTYKYRTYNYKDRKYEYDRDDRLRFPIWLLLLLSLFLVPYLNIVLFILGIICYSFTIFSEGIYFNPPEKLKKLINFLNKDL